MTDTPQNIKTLQLKIWLSKPPGERLRQFIEDNAALYQFWSIARKEQDKAAYPSSKTNRTDVKGN